MGSKRQQTFAKMEREQNAAAERLAGEAEPVLDGDLPEGQDDQVEGQEQEQQLGP